MTTPLAPVMPQNTRVFKIASRASQLAQVQTNMARDELAAAHPSKVFTTLFMSTEGDKNQAQALYLLGGKALWTKELEVALKENEVDFLVHSLKDVPTVLPDGCEIGAIMKREDPVDSLVVKKGLDYKSLDDLPAGSTVGTSSVRRVAQLRRAYPQLKFADVVRDLLSALMMFELTLLFAERKPVRSLLANYDDTTKPNSLTSETRVSRS